MTAQWVPPDDLDGEVLEICQAMNAFPGVYTIESCCGHGRNPVRVFFRVWTLTALVPLLYWVNPCHTGQDGWKVSARTDCLGDFAVFALEGPVGAYDSAAVLAAKMREAAAQL